MLLNNQIDYSTNDVTMNQRISHPNSIGFSNYLVTNFGINFLLQKQSIRLSIGNYLNVFDTSIWLLFLVSVLAIASVEGSKVKSLKLTFDLIFNYLNVLFSLFSPLCSPITSIQSPKSRTSTPPKAWYYKTRVIRSFKVLFPMPDSVGQNHEQRFGLSNLQKDCL